MHHKKKDQRWHRSPAELALAFFSKVDEFRSRCKTAASGETSRYCTACRSRSKIPTVNSLRRKNYSSVSASSSLTEGCLSQGSTGTGKSCQSEPPMIYSSRSVQNQCSCGKRGRDRADDCSAVNFVKAGVSRSRDGLVRVRRRGERRVRGNNCTEIDPRGKLFPDNFSVKSVAVLNTRSIGVCTERESSHSIKDMRQRNVSDRERSNNQVRVDLQTNSEAIGECRAENVFDDNAGDDVGLNLEKITSGKKCNEKVSREGYQKSLVNRSPKAVKAETQKPEFHDAATGIPKDPSRRTLRDKAVGDDREIQRRRDFKREGVSHSRRENLKNPLTHFSRHNLRRKKSTDNNSRHVHYEKYPELNNRPQDISNERNTCDMDKILRTDDNLEAANRDRVREKLSIGSRDVSREKKSLNCTLKTISVKDAKSSKDGGIFVRHCECPDSSCCEPPRITRENNNVREDTSGKNSTCSKMSFVLNDQTRQFFPDVSERSVATETSDSYLLARLSKRRETRGSRKR